MGYVWVEPAHMFDLIQPSAPPKIRVLMGKQPMSSTDKKARYDEPIVEVMESVHRGVHGLG